MTKPDETSADYKAMSPYWEKVGTILRGADAMHEAGTKYLPKLYANTKDQESDDRYRVRLDSARFTNIFGDIVENLAQRPFGEPVKISDDGAPEEIGEFVDDVDARGNSLHVFAGDVFFYGIANAVDWILVDYTKGVPEGATRADEAALGARPYWVRYTAPSVLAVYSAMVNGKEAFTHVRLAETATVREGWKEVERKRVRILDRPELEGGNYGPATWELWEEQEAAGDRREWVRIDGGDVSIGVIPLVPFVTGRRHGSTWRFRPPMRDAADLQVKHYQKQSAHSYAEDLVCFPMIRGNNIDPPMEGDKPKPLPVGPGGVLYGDWDFIEPDGASLRQVADTVDGIAKELRELGKQPLTPQSGNITVVTSAMAAEKSNAAIQAWALNLKDALENALLYTAMWLKLDGYDPVVEIDTDFDLGWGEDTFEHVTKMGERQWISPRQVTAEAKRRNILSPEYDFEEDQDEIDDGMMPGRSLLEASDDDQRTEPDGSQQSADAQEEDDEAEDR